MEYNGVIAIIPATILVLTKNEIGRMNMDSSASRTAPEILVLERAGETSRPNTGTPGVQWSSRLFIVDPQHFRSRWPTLPLGPPMWCAKPIRAPRLGWGVVVVMTPSSSKQPPGFGLVGWAVGIRFRLTVIPQ